jgi:hypothetical protein
MRADDLPSKAAGQLIADLSRMPDASPPKNDECDETGVPRF